MKKHITQFIFTLILIFTFLSSANAEILIGMEYVLIDRPAKLEKTAKMLSEIGAPTGKNYPEHLEWSQMQKGPLLPIDFTRSDNFVRSFQNNNFTDLVICLRSKSPWASTKPGGPFNQGNPVPKDQFMGKFADWISAVVERYDGDGKNDMPGLKHPVRYYEIGSEFSSYEPEPPEEYLKMLEVAYKAAHQAFPNVQIAHAAFLVTNMFKDNPSPAEYEQAASRAGKWLSPKEHTLADIRKILDRPDVFDVLNVHALGDPKEIEAMTKWLDYETSKRHYSKRKIISDTMTNPFIGWGPATVCDQPKDKMGEIVYPVREEDRCRVADYFQKVVKGDRATIEWLQGYAGLDNVKKIVIADEQDWDLIDAAFIEDLYLFKLPLFKAGTGNSAWSGLLDVDRNEKRAGFYALKQITQFLKGSSSIKRIDSNDDQIRVYEVNGGGPKRFIAWYEPNRVYLPGDEVPQKEAEISVGSGSVRIEEIITKFKQTEPEVKNMNTSGGSIKLNLTPTPLLIQ